MSALPFDPYGPLPTGTVVLEASAGTGKTWTIATLATRYVAEGLNGRPVELSQLMLVTFGRAATQELRERTRERMVSAARGLADPTAADPDDELVARLAATDRAERHRRLVRALSDFDAATIATTHSFCQRMLDGLGTAGEREPHAALVEEVDDLTREVADDLYLQRYADVPNPPLTATEARRVALPAVRDRQARLEPQCADDTVAGHRVALAVEARREVERRKRQRGIRDFDDLLSLLRDVLADPERGPAAIERIRERYAIVLVDEFQDTDPVQWEVLRRAFHGHTTLVLIGDPKQAVYAFRGAEVRSYLDAVGLAGQPRTLARNWRSDAGLVAGLEHLYGGAALGHEQIVVRPVEAAHPDPRLTGAPPFRLRQVGREGRLYDGLPTVAAVRARVAVDVVEDMVRLLSGPARFDGRPVRPGDVAVLARTWKQLAFVCDALDRAGLPWVLGSSSSVFATPAAVHWRYVLQALEQPHRAARVRLAALTPLLGATAADLAADADGLVTDLGLRLREWAALFARAGFAAVYERLAAWSRLGERLLAQVNGERQLTDLRHLAQALDEAAVGQGLGLTALTVWLSERIDEPSLATTAERSRRLDSDAAAVQVVTVHASKGLEFPVVYVPFGWDGARPKEPDSLLLHDGLNRVRDIGGRTGPGYAARKAKHDAEEAGEELRLLYVALTRAQSQVVAWWAPSGPTVRAPLHRLLFGRRPGSSDPAPSVPVPEDAVVTARLSAWAASGGVVHEVADQPTGLRWQPTRAAAADLAAAAFTRSLDLDWRRSSYSALTATAHETAAYGVGSEAEQPGTADEPDAPPPSVDGPVTGPPSLFDAMPGGAAFGTLVHEILEAVDTSAPDLPAELSAACQRGVATRLAGVDPDALATALLAVLRTPLAFSPDVTLAGVASTDQLTELDFELPLAGGDQVRPAVTLAQVATLLRSRLPGSDPLAAYAERLAELDESALRGYLTGSIDLVLRLPGPRYVVVDHKTNRFGEGELTALHYSGPAMAAEMLRQHYPLQALLYSVALHRYLRWRQPGYSPETHLGGVRYLFLRGMVGPATPPGCGVLAWDPPAALVAELSDLLAGRS